jgi:hypothetical protein
MDSVNVVQLLEAETYLGNPYWYRLAGTAEQYVWAGGVAGELVGAESSSPVVPINVQRRADGTILPLQESELMARYGTFTYKSNANGSIVIDPPWESQNIVDFVHPLLAQMHLSRLRVHQAALQSFQGAFDAIQQSVPSVSDCLRTCGGTYVPRHVNWTPGKPLSSHAFGVAIDLNPEWNGYKRQPTAPGLIGSVQELVPYFAQFGFAWGGHFSASSIDGMHFELALR